jgi:polyhydroxybutyrate depolymerase
VSFDTDGGDGSTNLQNVCAGGVVGGSRPATVRTFTGYDCTTPAPLVILLHDYGSTGALAEAYFDFNSQADALGFLYVHPDGTKDSTGNEFWNATDACCNVDGSTVDDSTYLLDLISQIRDQFNVDKTRIYVFGYGNGGFMAYRMACDHGTVVTAVADLGGAMWDEVSKCALKAPVGALEVHGTNDATFLYDGGTDLAAYPSAPSTAAEWVTEDHCTSAASDAGANLDLDTSLAGAETTVTNWGPCPSSTSIALWTIQGGTHTPSLSTSFAPSVLGFLLAQKKL